MKEIYVAQLKTEQDLTDYFMVKSIAIKLGANKKQYLDIMLGDGTGEISGKKWDVADAELEALNQIKEGDIVKVKAIVTEWNGLRQLRVGRIRLANNAADEVDIKNYIKAAPEDPQDMYDYIYSVAKNMDDQDLKKLCIKTLDDDKERLMYYPAASKNHHAEFGGLLYHMKRMLMTGERICQVYTNLNKDLVCAGVILHDMQKLNEIESDTMGISSGYSFEGQMLGHIVMGVSALDKVMTELEFPREKAIMVEHMILSHHYEPEFGSPKRPLFPEAEVLHYLDILDARMFDMEDALIATEPGDFSEKVWTLDNRRIYKPQED